MASRQNTEENLKRRRRSHWLTFLEILMALAVLACAVFLFLYWQTDTIFFCLEFGFATALFIVLSVDTALQHRGTGRTAALIGNLVCTAAMISLLTVSILVKVLGT